MNHPRKEISELRVDVIKAGLSVESRQVALNLLVEALHFEAWADGWAACIDEYSDLIFDPLRGRGKE